MAEALWFWLHPARGIRLDIWPNFFTVVFLFFCLVCVWFLLHVFSSCKRPRGCWTDLQNLYTELLDLLGEIRFWPIGLPAWNQASGTFAKITARSRHLTHARPQKRLYMYMPG